MSEQQKKKRRAVARSNNRSIMGTSLEVIQKKRTEKPEIRQASREAAVREVKVSSRAGLRGRGGGAAPASVCACMCAYAWWCVEMMC